MKKTNLMLKGRVIQKFGSYRDFACNLGKSVQTVSAKLNGKVQFTQADIVEWCGLLDIKSDEIMQYFFAD